MSEKGTIGWDADHLKVDEKALEQIIEEYSHYKKGTVGNKVFQQLEEYKEKDALGRVVMMELAQMERNELDILLHELGKVARVIE